MTEWLNKQINFVKHVCMCMFSHVRLIAIPWTVACQAPLSIEFSRQEYWSVLPFPTPGDLPYPRSNSHLLTLLPRQVDSLPLHHLESPIKIVWCSVQFSSVAQFSSVQSLSRVRLFITPWITAYQAFLFITNSRSSHKLLSMKLVMPPSHLILCCLLLLLAPIPPSIRVFSNESTLGMR